MKDFTEFKGYRTRTVYEPESKSFIACKAPNPDFGRTPGDAALPEGWRVEVDLCEDVPARRRRRPAPRPKPAFARASRAEPEPAYS